MMVVVVVVEVVVMVVVVCGRYGNTGGATILIESQ
jgi:hypothetical protein